VVLDGEATQNLSHFHSESSLTIFLIGDGVQLYYTMSSLRMNEIKSKAKQYEEVFPNLCESGSEEAVAAEYSTSWHKNIS
jgi:hypothetical protein